MVIPLMNTSIGIKNIIAQQGPFYYQLKAKNQLVDWSCGNVYKCTVRAPSENSMDGIDRIIQSSKPLGSRTQIMFEEEPAAGACENPIQILEATGFAPVECRILTEAPHAYYKFILLQMISEKLSENGVEPVLQTLSRLPPACRGEFHL
jgi:hypothetical protein